MAIRNNMYSSTKDGSLQTLRDAAKRDPQNEAAWLNLADAAEAKGDRPTWTDSLQKLIVLAPSVAKYRFQLGEILREDQNFTEARRLFEQVLEISPMHPKARRHLAELNGVVIAKPTKTEPLRREDFIQAIPSPKMTEMPPEAVAASRAITEAMLEELYGKKRVKEPTPDFRTAEFGKSSAALNPIPNHNPKS
jgi:tetratricopeptide (TPR) repeat protein